MVDIETQRVIVETYDGTLESAALVLKNLNIDNDYYHFNIITKKLILIKFGLILAPGDCYQYTINQERFSAI